MPSNPDTHSKSIFLFLLIFFAWNNFADGQEAWGSLKTVSETVNIRKRRSIKSRIIGKLYAGETVKADFTRNDWTAVFPADETMRYVSNVNKYYIAYSLASTLDCLENRSLLFK